MVEFQDKSNITYYTRCKRENWYNLVLHLTVLVTYNFVTISFVRNCLCAGLIIMDSLKRTREVRGLLILFSGAKSSALLALSSGYEIYFMSFCRVCIKYLCIIRSNWEMIRSICYVYFWGFVYWSTLVLVATFTTEYNCIQKLVRKMLKSCSYTRCQLVRPEFLSTIQGNLHSLISLPFTSLYACGYVRYQLAIPFILSPILNESPRLNCVLFTL